MVLPPQNVDIDPQTASQWRQTRGNPPIAKADFHFLFLAPGLSPDYFFDGIEKYTPQIISWNGGGFDLPVLHYRGLIHGINASRYWDLGEDDKEFKWNNYISRYHARHLDLMDVMAMFNARANAPLDDLAKLCGFPGKLGMDGSKVWDAYKAGGIEDIRNYCETDVANTHLVFLRFQLMRGHLTPAAYEAEITLVRDTLASYTAPHWAEFLAAWRMP